MGLIKVDSSAIHQAKWHEYVVRFLLGGAITAATGLIAKEFGPIIGGLFLAFPAIFPATATLAEKREKERKRKKGLSGVERGRLAAAAEAAGAALGSLGLVAFACVFWLLLPRLDVWLVFLIAVTAWTSIAVGMWFARKYVRIGRKHTLVAGRVSS